MNNTQKKVGLAVARIQPLHKGHANLIYKMLCENDTVIIVLGSAQISKTMSNPYTVKERITFIQKVFGESKKIKILPLKDINAVSKKDWGEYVLGELKKAGFPTPTDYYAGSNDDGAWFGKSGLNVNILDRYSISANMSGTDIRKSISNDGTDWLNQVPYCIQDIIKEKFPKELTLEENIS